MWLLEQAIFDLMQAALAAGMLPTAEQQIEYEARAFGADGDGPRLLTVAGDQAEITVSGVITQKPDFLAMLFGGGNVTYQDISAAVEAAENDDAIKKITMKVDSPGGQFEGLFETLAVMENAKKPIEVIASKAASAAYAIVSKADKITAVNRASMFGSVGVVASLRVNDNVVEIASTEAPKKRPDVTTEAGKAVMREQVDALHEIFADAIATGRGTTVENVNTNFGQGATLLADEALKQGMIDGIADTPLRAVKKPAANGGGTQTKENAMDLQELKAKHPDLYSAVRQEGITVGTTQERDRVGAFIVAGEQSGDMKTALTAVKDGSAMTQTLSTQFLMAAANRGTQTAAAEDDTETAAAVDGAETDDAEADATANANLLTAAAESCGVDLEG